MDMSTLLAIAGLGASAGGAILGSRAQGQANDLNQQNADRLFGIADQERARRDQLTNTFMPSIYQNMRMKPPTGGVPQIGGPPNYGTGQQSSRGLAQPTGGGSGALGDTAMGAGLGMQFGGPVGAGIGAGVGAASNLFGGGRRAANAWTKTTQNDFGQQVAGIIDPYNAAKSSGSLTPEATTKAQGDFNRLLAEYTAAANQYGGQGKQQGKVIGQMWNQFNGPGYIPSWKSTLGIGA